MSKYDHICPLLVYFLLAPLCFKDFFLAKTLFYELEKQCCSNKVAISLLVPQKKILQKLTKDVRVSHL